MITRNSLVKGERIFAPDLLKIGLMFVVAISAIVASLFIGRYSISMTQFWHLIAAKLLGLRSSLPENVEMVFFRVRLPRVIVAFLAGSGLAVAGASYQGVFRNPMVSPDILGATAGAGLGAALALLFSFSSLGVQIVSFVMGIVAVSITYLICLRVGKRGNTILTLVLAGMVVSALFQAGISLIKFTADPYTKLPEITFWLMGSMASVKVDDIAKLGIPLVCACIPLFLLRWQVNLLAFSDEEASAMGVNTQKIRFLVILCSTLITSGVVSIGGIIGWVGLVMPHLTRMIVGPDYKVLMPASILLGGTYLLLVDDLARSMTAMEIPLGILTAVIGAPFFIYLLCGGRSGWL